MKIIAALLILSTCLMGGDTGVFLGNALGHGLMTAVNGVIHGNVKNLKQFTTLFLKGVPAGVGFYASKKLVSNGKVFQGVLLANLSASVTENIIKGKTPLSSIGYSIGPIRIKYEKKIKVEFSLWQAANLAISMRYGKMDFRDGLLTFTAKRQYIEDGLGWCKGIFPTVAVDSDMVYKHECIHVIQDLQLMSLSYEPIKHVRLHLFSAVATALTASMGYDNDLREIEAHFFNK
jgi:hypothetical protein